MAGVAMAGRQGRVCAVVVTYRPDVALLRKALAAIRPQVDALLLVDNATDCPRFHALKDEASASGLAVHVEPENRGLAAGFNRGIDHARASGCDYVLLLDQDSIPAPGMVAALRDAHRALSAARSVAAVGPCFIDPRDGAVAPFVRIGFPFNRKQVAAAGQRVACDFLISSGCLIPLAIIDDVGAMDATLFIDNVDLDWCFRARARGHALYGIADARMQHSIGDAVRTSRLTRTQVFIHSPARLYYLMRNRLLLYRRVHTPATWIAQDMPRLLAKFLRMAVFVGPRRANAAAMLRGIRDGLLGRSGRMDDPGLSAR